MPVIDVHHHGRDRRGGLRKGARRDSASHNSIAGYSYSAANVLYSKSVLLPSPT